MPRENAEITSVEIVDIPCTYCDFPQTLKGEMKMGIMLGSFRCCPECREIHGPNQTGGYREGFMGFVASGCRHVWREAGRAYQQGVMGKTSEVQVKGMPMGNTFDQTLYGFTTIEQRCVHCGEVKHNTVTGDVTKIKRN